MGIAIIGENPICGEVRCGGAKNLSIKVIIASILTRSIVRLKNIPKIHDVDCSLAMCKAVGVQVLYEGDVLILDSRMLSINSIEINKITSRMPILFLAVLLNFFPEIKVPAPVGCHLGDRKLDFHIQILEKFGHSIKEDVNSISGRKKDGFIIGSFIDLPYPSVGATETALFSSILSKGKSIISGIAIEPEIKSLIVFLQACGAKIIYSAERELTIYGVEKLHGTTFEAEGDRVEAASWACLACTSNGRVKVSGISVEHLSTFLGIYRLIGGDFSLISRDEIEFYRSESGIKPVFLETGPYPQLSTDYQPIIAVVLSLAEGSSVLHETLFNNRLGYFDSFLHFGINSTRYVECIGSHCNFRSKNNLHSVIINGASAIHPPAEMISVDTIRSGFAYIILAAISKGTTRIRNTYIIERGIEKLLDKIESVGIKYEIFEE